MDLALFVFSFVVVVGGGGLGIWGSSSFPRFARHCLGFGA